MLLLPCEIVFIAIFMIYRIQTIYVHMWNFLKYLSTSYLVLLFQTFGLPYECDSVMHYGYKDFAAIGR